LAQTQVYTQIKEKKVKTIRYITRLLLVLIFFTTHSDGYAQSVKIYHVGVGQGDATIFLFTDSKGDTASVLIDAGNSKSKGAAVFSVANALLGTKKRVDFVITSHLHSDHIGGMAEFFTQASAAGWTFGYIIDRAAQPGTTPPVLCYDNGDTTFNNDPEPAIPVNNLMGNYVAALKKIKFISRINIKQGVDLFNFKFLEQQGFNVGDFHFFCLTSNGRVCSNVDCTAYVDLSAQAHNENDYSYSFYLLMGQFDYFTGGDIGGGQPYVDLETPLVALFDQFGANNFHFCGYKATHHGSPNSTNTAFANYTKPTVTVVPSALRSFSGTQIPGWQALARIWTANQPLNNDTIFYTYRWTGNSKAWSGSVDRYRDVVLYVEKTAFTQNHKINIQTQEREKTGTLAPIAHTTTNTDFECKKHGGLVNEKPVFLFPSLSNPSQPPVTIKPQPPVAVKKIVRYKKRPFRKYYKRKRRIIRHKHK
jgi:competence protein ComEC